MEVIFIEIPQPTQFYDLGNICLQYSRMFMLTPRAMTFARNHPVRGIHEAIPLQPIDVEEPFEKLGLDIISEINPHSYKKHTYILSTTNYFTHWMEFVPLNKVNDEVVIIFLEQHIMTRFGVPTILVLIMLHIFHC
jgi:hypothetical protein